jgi:hypothetical protein
MRMVSQAPIRVLLSISTVSFLVAAVRRTDSTRQLAQVATGALGGSLAMGALSAQLSTVTLLLLTAGLLAGPPVWRPARRGLAPGRRAA